MAMIKCPDCKTPISDTAECCPRCGCKFQAEYEQVQRLRQWIYELENDRSPRPAEPSGGMGGCAIVGILPLIIGIVLVIDGFIGFIRGEVFLGIITIVVGGFIAYWCFMFVAGTIGFAETRKDKQKRAIADYDARSARIAELKRQLAQLEAKFR